MGLKTTTNLIRKSVKRSGKIFLFFLTWSLVFCNTHVFSQTYNIANGTITTCSGTIYDSGGSAGNYGNGQTFTQTICSGTAGQCVSLNFTAFNLEANFDYLYVYNGSNTAAPLIGTYTGTTLPGTVTATSGCLTLVFTSDLSVVSTGFAATISCSPCVPGSTNIIMGNGSVTACGGTFYDSGGAGGAYGNNQTLTQTICSSTPGQCVSLNFSSFDLESGFDFLTIYNGPNTSSPLIGTFTGTTSPGTVTATSGCLTLVFTSDVIITSPGFAASISCVTCPNTAPCTTTCNGGSPPTNDACSGAQNLGTLPAPPICPTNNGVGPWTYFNTTNLCATAEQPYTSLIGCQPAGNMPSPSADVWYQVNITGPTLNINITGLQSPSVGLYAGTNCTNMIPRGCANGSGGSLNTTFGSLAPGTYFLQVSGGSITDQCDFTLGLQNNNDCQGCVIQANLTASPPPINGTYQAGQTVTFCYTITNYNQTSNNWLHGVVPTFGSGWNMASLVTGPVTSCSNQGTWNYYNNNVTSSATGVTTGPGYYFESGFGSPSGFADGNPGNNYGDNNPGNLCDWTFCWTISTPPASACVQGASLNLAINTLGDGESGSWTSLACTQDADAQFFATLSCCTIPTYTLVQPLCAGQNTGSATVTITNDPPWDYVFTNSTGTTIQTFNNLNGPATVNNLAPGTYNVSVTNASGCVSNTSFTITAPAILNATATPTGAACFGTATGSVSVSASGGTAPYQYAWSGSSSTSSTLSNLPIGTYTVTVTDANGCTRNASAVVTQPAAVSATASAATATCSLANGSGSISASGGTPGYTYSLNGGVSQSSNSFNGLATGNYSVTITDSRGCTATVPLVVGNQPGPTITSTSSTPPSCNGGNNGTATVIASGGTAPVRFSINGSPLQASNSFAGLTPGSYTILASDANGCTSTSTVNVANPIAITASASVNNASCSTSNGSFTVSASGGTGSFTYSLNGGASSSNTTFTNLSAASYNVIVTDANGCTFLLPVAVGNQLAPTITSTISNPVLCNGGNNGSLSVSASGGTGSISYTLNGGTPQSSGSYSNLAAGTYTVSATDANGCTAVTNITITQPTPVTAASSSGAIACFGGTTSVSVSGGGGTAPYSGTGSFTVGAGAYSYTVTDANGCTAVTNIAVTQPSLLNANFTSTAASCGNNNGSTTINASGGTSGYTYSINSGTTTQTSNTFSGLLAGTYPIIVTDANSCTTTVNASVSNTLAPTISVVNSTNNTCFNSNNGSIVINASGGTGSLQYSINNGNTYQP
ncbi:MAG: CUB domain-containing protein, partial [Bacteroidota bacterium]